MSEKSHQYAVMESRRASEVADRGVVSNFQRGSFFLFFFVGCVMQVSSLGQSVE